MQIANSFLLDFKLKNFELIVLNQQITLTNTFIHKQKLVN